MTTIVLSFNPNDFDALTRVVDPDHTRNGTSGVFLDADEAIRMTYMKIVEDGELVVEGKALDIDPLTAAIIVLSHNSADDYDLVNIWADGGVDDSDPTYVKLIGRTPDQIMAMAAQFATAVQIAADLELDVDPMLEDDYGMEQMVEGAIDRVFGEH